MKHKHIFKPQNNTCDICDLSMAELQATHPPKPSHIGNLRHDQDPREKVVEILREYNKLILVLKKEKII